MIKNIIDKIEIAKKNIENMNREKMENINKIVIEYIKKYKCIIYGGTAIHNHLLNASVEGIYPVGKIYDYDFYHWNNINIAIEIADELNRAGYKYIRCVRGMQTTTYKIIVEFGSVTSDISYIPKNVYNLMLSKQWSTNINGIYYLNPMYILKDQYKIITTNFVADSFRIPKVRKRIQLLLDIRKKEKTRQSSIATTTEKNEVKLISNTGSNELYPLKFTDNDIFLIDIDGCIEFLSYKPFETIKFISNNIPGIIIYKMLFYHQLNYYIKIHNPR